MSAILGVREFFFLEGEIFTALLNLRSSNSKEYLNN